MPTSQTSSLSKPTGDERIEPWKLAYFQARNRSRAHELVLNEFLKSGLTQIELAHRLKRQPAVISRLLGAPGNWGLDTVSDLLFAISGAEVKYEAQYPLDEPPKNYRFPEWLTIGKTAIFSTGDTIIVSATGQPLVSATDGDMQIYELRK